MQFDDRDNETWNVYRGSKRSRPVDERMQGRLGMFVP